MPDNRFVQTRSGKILSCIGGIYAVQAGNECVNCYAKGAFRHEKITPLAGDDVMFCLDADEKRAADGYIVSILPRKNQLIRPPVANIDRLFIVVTLSHPVYSPLSLDKLLVLAVHNKMEPVIILNKTDLASPDEVDRFLSVYRTLGCPLFTYSAKTPDPDATAAIKNLTHGVVSAFAGASGVGKSTIINALFPHLGLQTGLISTKTERGKHTTRQSRLFRLDEHSYLADTPGFSLLDFERFFFLSKDELPEAFPEFLPFLHTCRYTKCTHRTEDGCAILEGIECGNISKQRHTSYVSLYSEVATHKEWQLKK